MLQQKKKKKILMIYTFVWAEITWAVLLGRVLLTGSQRNLCFHPGV